MPRKQPVKYGLSGLTDPDLSDQLLTRGVETAIKLLNHRA